MNYNDIFNRIKWAILENEPIEEDRININSHLFDDLGFCFSYDDLSEIFEDISNVFLIDLTYNDYKDFKTIKDIVNFVNIKIKA